MSIRIFRNTESRETQGLMARVDGNMNNEIDNLNLTDYSWSNWDDTYHFVSGS